MPVDRAKLLAGQQFDLRVELAGGSGPLKVMVNGQEADRVLAASPVLTNTSPSSAEYAIRGVAFKQPGKVEVVASGDAAGRVLEKKVSWEVTEAKPPSTPAKNVILFVGDGMGVPMRTAARILSRGMAEGRYNGMLEMDQMETYGAIMTSGLDSIATDSANSMSAYMTGHKSAVNAMGVYPDNTPDPNDDPRVETLAEVLKRTRGMGIGVVTTTEIQDATPAAVFAHTRRRSEYVSIMDQALRDSQAPDVLMGGGSASLLPQTTPGSTRKDDRNLFDEFKAKGYAVATTGAELASASDTGKLLGIFHTSNMGVYLDRMILKNQADFPNQPTLWEMTERAIQVLSKNQNGFFLMVEGGSIDKMLHPMDTHRAVYDTIELDKAVGVAKRWAAANGNSTLIVVTADHSHGASVTGTWQDPGPDKTAREGVRVYELAGFPTYIDADKDGFPDDPNPTRRLAIGYANHPDYYEDYTTLERPTVPANKEGDNYVANAQRNSTGRGDLIQGNLPRSAPTEVHTVEDVPVTASGPGAAYFGHTLDNTEVFFGVIDALGVRIP